MRTKKLGPEMERSWCHREFTKRHGWSALHHHARGPLNSSRRGNSVRLAEHVAVPRIRLVAEHVAVPRIRLVAVAREEKKSVFWDCHTTVAGRGWARGSTHVRIDDAREGAHTPMWLVART